PWWRAITASMLNSWWSAVRSRSLLTDFWLVLQKQRKACVERYAWEEYPDTGAPSSLGWKFGLSLPRSWKSAAASATLRPVRLRTPSSTPFVCTRRGLFRWERYASNQFGACAVRSGTTVL